MPDLAFSFTSSRDLDHGGEEVILNVLHTLPLAARYITGAARGGDAFIGRWLVRNRPEAEHIVIQPYDIRQVDPWWLDAGIRAATFVDIIPMPVGSTFKDRNAELVRRGTVVCGFPAYPENNPSSLRSGSWQTLRMARDAGKLHRWDCVKPPYRGRVEKYLREFGYQEAGHG